MQNSRKQDEARLQVVLVNLQASTDDWTHILMPPLGLQYLSASLAEAFEGSVSIEIIDRTLGLSDEELYFRLQRLEPDLVGLRGFSSHAAEFPHVARIAKHACPRTLVIAGGPHASTRAQSLLEAEDIDGAVFGEGEATLVEVVSRMLAGKPLAGIPGLGGRVLGKHTLQERPFATELDELPFPDYERIDLDRYQGQVTMTSFLSRARFTSIFTSRGCHYRCFYCHDNFGRSVRYRSPQNVIDEMAWLIEEHGVGEFHVVDDIFNADKHRAIQIFEAIEARNWNIALAFPNGLRGDRMDEEFIAAARAAGTYHWALAIESAVPRIQKLIRKFNDLERLQEVIELSDRYGIFTCTFNMLGFPSEEESEMRKTIEYSLASRAHQTNFFVATPYERTGFHDYLSEQGWSGNAEGGGSGYSTFTPETHDASTVPKPRLQQLIRDAYFAFYSSPDRLRRVRALADRTHGLPEIAWYYDAKLRSSHHDPSECDDRTRASLAEFFRAARREAPDRIPPSAWQGHEQEEEQRGAGQS